jgi:hypothetical protein
MFERPDGFWHQVDIAELSSVGANDFASVACNYRCTGDACRDPSYFRTWKYEQDFERWSPLFPGLTMSQEGKYDETKAGRFWFHVDTPVGMHPGVAREWGFPVHTKNDGVTPADSLANHYEPLEPRYVVSSVSGKTVPSPEWTWQKWEDCWACDKLDSPVSNRIRVPLIRAPGESLVLSQFDPSHPERFGVLLPGGGALELTDELDATVRTSLAHKSLVWLSPAEASSLRA